jgi:phosphatidylglycerophosphate synthase
VNLANKITLLRLSLLPSIFFLILAAKDYDIAPVLFTALGVAFITDMIDGRLSRARNEVTRIGRIMDSVSDYSLLLVIAVAYRVFGIIPSWLFWIIFGRLLFQALGMLAILVVKGNVEPQPTILGKIAIATTMSLFALEVLKLVAPPSILGLFPYIESAAGIIVAVSVVDKGYYFIKHSR